MKSSLSVAAAALTVAGTVVADDFLYSKRLTKRFVDEEGHQNISFFHVNDIHAHLDQFASSGTACEDPEDGCYGGYARIKTKVDELREQSPDNLWLNAGDEFQGTLFYQYYGGEKIAETINDLGFDAMTLGNHEWDGGEEELGQFLNNLTFPVVSCNVKSEYAPLKDNIKNYVLFEEQGVAVIGATTVTTPGISSVGNTTDFLDPVIEVQKAIYEIRNETDINRIVLLSHLGYDVDQDLAENTEGLSLIIGGHSHTLLGDMEDALGDYPTIAEDLSGREVFIVTAYRWGEYLGAIDLTFDDEGRALAYHGAPIHMTNTTELDPELDEKIQGWAEAFADFAAEVLGETDAVLVQETCQDGDCLLGQVMADAMFEYRFNQTEGTEDEPALAIINAGGVRAEINEGEITRGEVLTAFPFGNAIVELEFSGSDLRQILEGAVSGVNQFNDEEITSWFQVSRGVRIEFNPENEAGSKIVNVTLAGEPLEDEETYRVVTLDFLAGGGDNIFVSTTDFITLDTQDEVLTQYIEARTPLSPELEERVVESDGQAEEGGDSEGGEGNEEGSGSEGGAEGEGEGEEEVPEDAAGMLAAPFWTALVGATVAVMTI
ncbi:Metallo-dependent phosphatase-like protein [Aspergillus karnatakaensis]|uniref:bifunctional metallophosphatase/5'-nucleotidase n=1 Tax=Aspergillus karnatakaensis TaxID=1810916 RepID=UPI003CCE0BDC